jgi:acyl-CoA thioester hydrolase
MYAKLAAKRINGLEITVPPKDRFVSEVTLWVRYAETDSMRIVHHSNYLVYFEEARSDYMRQRGENYANFERDGFNLAVTEVNVRYLRAAVYGQQITIKCWIEDVQSRGMTFGYETVNSETGELHCTGQTKHICVSRDGGVTRLPERWRDWVTKSLQNP